MSCDSDEFNKASQIYNDALKTSGYREGLQYIRNDIPADRNRRNRPTNIIWFNPPYSANVQTNVARSFLCLIDKHFPRSHVLHKIFNRNNVKVSYSCMNNMAKIIKSHNAKILGKVDASSASDKQCNCRTKDLCPLNGACLTNNVKYKATVTTAPGDARVYIGIVSRPGSTTTRFPSSTASTRMTLSYPNTSGTLRTATPISKSSGRLSRVQDLIGETRHAIICA